MVSWISEAIATKRIEDIEVGESGGVEKQGGKSMNQIC